MYFEIYVFVNFADFFNFRLPTCADYELCDVY